MVERFLIVILAVIGLLIVLFVVLKILKKRKNLFSKDSQFENIILQIRVTKDQFEKHTELQAAPIAAEQLFASLHGLLKETRDDQEHISFEMVADKDGINFYCAVPPHLKGYVENQIYAQYSDAQISILEKDYMFAEQPAPLAKSVTMGFVKKSMYPIKTFRDFEVDPLSAVTSAISDVQHGENIWLQFLFRPIPDGWQEEGYKYIKEVTEGSKPIKLSLKEILREAAFEVLSIIFVEVPKRLIVEQPPTALPQRPVGPSAPKLSQDKQDELEAISNKLSKMGFEVEIKVACFAQEPIRLEALIRGVTASFRQFSTSSLNSFVNLNLKTDREKIVGEFSKRVLHQDKAVILNTEELASVYHLPASTVDTPTINWAVAKRAEPPNNLPVEGNDVNFFAKTTFRNKMVSFGIKAQDRARHMYFIGKSGVGKSTLFENMFIQDMRMGNGCCILDPHGSTAYRLLDFVPPERIDDVVILDPSDADRPVSLNLLELDDPTKKNLMGSALLAAFKKQFGQVSWGPRLEYLLNYAILTLLDVPGTTMLGITRLLADKNYQNYIVHKVKDPMLKDFWNKEFKEMKGNQSLISEALSPIQNKVGRFLASTTIRNVLGQRTSTIRLDDIMNSKKILFVNLAKGKIGEDNADLLGSLIISRIQFTAMQRQALVEKGVDVPPFYVFADEFQNFASDAFANILSEARKYRLCLHLTHQYIAQLPETLQQAIFGNVGTLVSFTLGAPDALIVAPEFAPTFDENDLISLEKHHIYLKMLIDGMTSTAFSGLALPPVEKSEGTRDEVIKRSRERYGRDVKEVEERVKLWLERPFDLGMAIAEEAKEKAEAQNQNVTDPKPEEVSPTEITKL